MPEQNISPKRRCPVPKYRVKLYYTLLEEYDVDAKDEEDAVYQAQQLNDQETDEEMMGRAEMSFSLEDATAELTTVDLQEHCSYQELIDYLS